MIELELGDGIHRGIHFGIIRQVAATERDAVVVNLILKSAAAGDRLGPRAGWTDARRELDEVRRVADAAAKGERHVEELLRLDDHAHVRRFGLNQGHTALDCNALGDGADCESDVDGCRLIRLNLNSALDVSAKTARLRCQIVGSDGKAYEAVCSCAGADSFKLRICSRIDDFQRYIWNRRSGVVCYDSSDGPAVALAKERTATNEVKKIKANSSSIPVHFCETSSSTLNSLGRDSSITTRRQY